jgi:hypothetical protein
MVFKWLKTCLRIRNEFMSLLGNILFAAWMVLLLPSCEVNKSWGCGWFLLELSLLLLLASMTCMRIWLELTTTSTSWHWILNCEWLNWLLFLFKPSTLSCFALQDSCWLGWILQNYRTNSIIIRKNMGVRRALRLIYPTLHKYCHNMCFD